MVDNRRALHQPKRVGNHRARINVRSSLSYFVLLVVALALLLPFWWMLLSALEPTQILTKTGIAALIPQSVTLIHFIDAFQEVPLWLYMKNTLFIAGFVMLGNLVSNTLVAYSLAKIPWKGRNVAFLIILATMMLPYQVTMIPLYILFHNLHWINTYLPLIVPAFFGNAFFIFLLRQFMMGIPAELSESARIDGASEIRVFYSVILPELIGPITAMLIFVFMGTWGDFVAPLLYLNNPNKWTISLGLYRFVSIHGMQWGRLMAASVVFALPIMILFAVGQGRLIKGLNFTGLKG